jgi:hypothetical protein
MIFHTKLPINMAKKDAFFFQIETLEPGETPQVMDLHFLCSLQVSWSLQ